MRDDGVTPALLPRDERVRVVLRLPAVPREPRRRGRRGGGRRAAAPRRGSTSCGTTSTTPASCAPMVDGVRLQRRLAEHGVRRSRDSCSPRTPSRRPTPTSSRPPDGRRRYVAQHRAVAGLIAAEVARRTGSSTRRGSSSTSPAPARRRSRGSSPTSATTSPCWPTRGCPGVVIVPIGFVSDHMEVRVGPRHRGAARRGRARPPRRARRDRGHRSAVRRDGARARPRARRRGAGRARSRRWARRTTSARRAAAPTRADRVRRCAGSDEADDARRPALPATSARGSRPCDIDYDPGLLDELHDLAIAAALEAAALALEGRREGVTESPRPSRAPPTSSPRWTAAARRCSSTASSARVPTTASSARRGPSTSGRAACAGSSTRSTAP